MTVLTRTGRYLNAPWTIAIVVLVSAMFVGQQLSGHWSGKVSHLQHALGYSFRDIKRGQWWRVLTPNLTNGPERGEVGPPGLRHLLYNVAGLLMVGPPVERRLGGPRYLILASVSGAAAYAWLLVPKPPANYVDGTSGMLFGIIGALAAISLIKPPKELHSRLGLLVVLLYALGGTLGQPLSTKHEHVAGFLAGLGLGLVFTWSRRTYASSLRQDEFRAASAAES